MVLHCQVQASSDNQQHKLANNNNAEPFMNTIVQRSTVQEPIGLNLNANEPRHDSSLNYGPLMKRNQPFLKRSELGQPMIISPTTGLPSSTPNITMQRPELLPYTQTNINQNYMINTVEILPKISYQPTMQQSMHYETTGACCSYSGSANSGVVRNTFKGNINLFNNVNGNRDQTVKRLEKYDDKKILTGKIVKKPRKKRTNFDIVQKTVIEHHFRMFNQKPTKEQYQTLSRILNVDEKTLRVCFQNKRAKQRRIQKKYQ